MMSSKVMFNDPWQYGDVIAMTNIMENDVTTHNLKMFSSTVAQVSLQPTDDVMMSTKFYIIR